MQAGVYVCVFARVRSGAGGGGPCGGPQVGGDCRSSAMNYPFTVDPRDFEAALVNAVNHAGHRLRWRDQQPRCVYGRGLGMRVLAPGPLCVCWVRGRGAREGLSSFRSHGPG